MYFESHPLITYDNEKVVDIFKKIIPSNQYLDNTILFELYDIVDGESPENLAYKLYGSAEHHWVLLTINNIVDVNKNWPMSQRDFNVYVSEKYNDPYQIHHYVDSDGDIIDKDEWESLGSVTSNSIENYSYEELINNNKVNIKILNPDYIMEFIENFKSLL
jgi:hypothetical protein